MEALVAVGLASNILQFVDFAKSVVSDAKKFYEAGSGANDGYQEAVDHAQMLQRLAAQVAIPWVSHGGEVSWEGKELRKISEQCSQIANELLAATRDITATSHNDWVQSARQAVKVRLSSSQVKSLQTRLDRISQQLTGRLLHAQLKNTEMTLNGMAAESRGLSSRYNEDIRHLQGQLDHVTTLLERGGSQRHALTSLAGIAEVGAQFSVEQLILGRLFFHGMNERHTNVHIEHEQTLSWIFEEDSPVHFAEFLESESSIYWVSGKPGSGKSTAMKYICQHSKTKRRLEQWANGNRLIIAKFFFWNAGRSSLLKSQEGLLQSILYQILRAAPALIRHAFPEDWAAYLSGGLPTSSSNAGSFSVAQLLSAIQLLAARLSQLDIKICIFVDGLDEYDGRPDDVIRLVEVLKTSKNLKACVSSRPWNEFEKAFGQDQTNKLYMQDLTKPDIRKYVQDTLEDNETFRELVDSEGDDHSMALVHDVVDAAQGVFLWVILVVRSLLEGLTNADTFKNLQRRLRRIPTDLDEYFERILFSVDEFYSSQASAMCLVTLTAATRLPLMSYWFMDQESSRYALDLEVKPMQPKLILSRLKAMEKRLNACCKGLLETIYDDSKSKNKRSPSLDFFSLKVDFLHRTVRDFLRTPQIQHRLSDRLPKDFNSEIVICQALLAQIKSSSHETKFFFNKSPFESLLQDFFLNVGPLEDETIPIQSEVELLDDIGSTLRIQVKNNIGDGYSSFRESEMLFSRCLDSGLLRYIYHVLERDPMPSRDELSDWLARTNKGVKDSHGSERQEHNLWTEAQLQLTRCLFKAGADPNVYVVSDSLRTPWTGLLDRLLDTRPIMEDRQGIVFSILKEFRKHGATLHSATREEQGVGLHYEEMLKRKMTQDQFNELFGPAHSKRNRNRVVNGLKRTPRLWKVLKKIEWHS